jgi:Potential Monad-binding region of RPAP3
VEGNETTTSVPEVPKAETSSSAKRKGPLIEEIPDPTPTPESNTPPKTFQQAKQERETRGPRKVGGGILKRDGSHSAAIFAPKVEVPIEAATPPPDPVVESKPVKGSGQPKKAPIKTTNAFEFQRHWQSDTDNEARWSLLQASDSYFGCNVMSHSVLQTVHPESLPAFFKNSMEPPLLSSIFAVLHGAITQKLASKESVGAYLQNMRKIPRFDMLTLLFSDAEHKTVQDLNNLVGAAS